MNILIVNPYYYPNNIGGTERVVKLLADEYVRQGHLVTVFTSDSPGEEQVEEILDGVNVYRGIAGKFLTEKKKGISGAIRNKIIHAYNFWLRRELEYTIQKYHPDVVHTQNLFGMSSIVWKVAAENGIPVVHTAHDYWMIRKGAIPFYRINNKYVNQATAPSECTAKKFIESGLFSKKKMAVVPNGMVMDRKAHAAFINEKSNRIGNKIKFLYVGQLTTNKGVDHLLEAFIAVKKLDIELYICGKGELQEVCATQAEKDERIHLMGLLPYNELEKVYQQADVLIAPSVWDEPFGMVALEAYYHALPVIGGDRGGLADIIKHVGSGCLINAENIDEIMNAIMLYSDRNKVSAEINKIGKSLFDYTVEKQANRFIEIYHKIQK